MAGMGKRMRPHSLTIPKPLIPVAGKPIVQHLIEGISDVCKEPIEEVAYVVGHFGEEVENHLKKIAGLLNAKASIYYQEEALGTAHAVHCAAESLSGKTIVAFADTLFRADFTINEAHDATIWVQKVNNPSAFGVVKLDDSGKITDFIEKPQSAVSDLAIIGIYYFKEGQVLGEALQHLIDNKIIVNGEYQLTDALENMKNHGTAFFPGEVIEWMDCGNKDATVHTNQRMLEYLKDERLISDKIRLTNAQIIPPCFIGENVNLENSIIGPHVSVGNNTKIKNALISNSIIQNDARISNAHINNSMLGNHSEFVGTPTDISISDYSKIKL